MGVSVVTTRKRRADGFENCRCRSPRSKPLGVQIFFALDRSTQLPPRDEIEDDSHPGRLDGVVLWPLFDKWQVTPDRRRASENS